MKNISFDGYVKFVNSMLDRAMWENPDGTIEMLTLRELRDVLATRNQIMNARSIAASM